MRRGAKAKVGMPRRLGRGLGARFPLPNIEGIRPDFAIGRNWFEMAAGTEVAVNEGVGGEKILSLPWGFEPLHLPLSSSCRSM
jgi:hypothetical protein